MRDVEASLIIDELLSLFNLYEKDYSIIDKALAFISETKQTYDNYPITISVANELRKRGLLEENK